MLERYQKQLKKGILEILVLKLISENRQYGYQLLIELKEKSHGMFVLKEGTLYPILYRLEEEGFIYSKWSEPIDKEIARKYYYITDVGVDNLKELEKLWKAFSFEVNVILGGVNDE